MAKASRAFVCQACGAVTTRWSGKCAACGEWNSITEETPPTAATPALIAIKGGKGRAAIFESLQSEGLDAPRLPTGMAELDRVLGGGLVPGSAVLVGGDPGIGKSTLLLQAAAGLASSGASVVYLSGEEAPAQVRMRGGSPRLERSTGRARHRDQPRQYRHHLEQGKGACSRRHRFGPDTMVGGA